MDRSVNGIENLLINVRSFFVGQLFEITITVLKKIPRLPNIQQVHNSTQIHLFLLGIHRFIYGSTGA